MVTTAYWKLIEWLKSVDAVHVETTSLARPDDLAECFERWTINDHPIMIHRFPHGTTGLEAFDIYVVNNGTIDIDVKIDRIATQYGVSGYNATH